MTKYSLTTLIRNNAKDLNEWKRLLTDAVGATVFHDPDFLAYHGDEFDEHHLGVFKGEALVGIIPMALLKEKNRLIAKSPYGASYGGFIFRSLLNYSDSRNIVQAFVDYVRILGAESISITPPPEIYYTSYSDTFVYALMECGFRVVNSDVTNVVFLSQKDIELDSFTSRARNMARKARRAGIVSKERPALRDFWLLMEKTFSKHGVKPTHSKEEFAFLQRLLPNDISCEIAVLNGKPVAGIGYIKVNVLVNMSFYLVADPDYLHTQALSLLIYEAILKSKQKGFKCFDFGTSSINMMARENIFQFKESFGAVGRFRNTIRLDFE